MKNINIINIFKNDFEENFSGCTREINGNENGWNVLKARRNGANVDIYIGDEIDDNDEPVMSVSQDILHNEGYFNLVIWGYAGLSDDSPGVVEFDYVQIDGLR